MEHIISENLKLGGGSEHNVFVEIHDVEWRYPLGSKRALILGNQIMARHLVVQGHTHNIVVNAGKAGASDRLLALASHPGYPYLGIGSGTNSPSVSDTTLQTEHTGDGLARVAASVSSADSGSGVFNKATWDYTWTKSTSGSLQVAEAGIFSAASSGIMFARVLVGPYTVGQSQTVRVLWTNTLG
jgi:hypothetical protein